MKHVLFVLAFGLIASTTIDAQRIAYVDIAKVMDAVPEYKEAQQQLDQLAAKWKQEIQGEYNKIDDMYRKYQAEQVLFSESTRKQKEEEIVNKEKNVRDLQKKRFGPDGELFKKRQELVQPIQDRVYKAIESYATERGFDFVFDRSSGVSILFANPRYDKTEDVMKKLGIK